MMGRPLSPHRQTSHQRFLVAILSPPPQLSGSLVSGAIAPPKLLSAGLPHPSQSSFPSCLSHFLPGVLFSWFPVVNHSEQPSLVPHRLLFHCWCFSELLWSSCSLEGPISAQHSLVKVILPDPQPNLAFLHCPQGPCAPSLSCHLRSQTVLELSASSQRDHGSLIYTSVPRTQSKPVARSRYKEAEADVVFMLRGVDSVL